MSQRYILRSVHTDQQGQWDAFVSQHPSGHLLQSWGWGELKASAGWHPLRLALWDTEQDCIAAAASVLRRAAPYLPLRAGHLAYIPKGPVLDWANVELRQTLFSQLDKYLRRHGALALQVELDEVSSVILSAVKDDRGQVEAEMRQTLFSLQFHPARPIQPIRTVLLDLGSDEDALLRNMKEKWRYNVRLAGRKGVQVRIAQTSEEVRNWYALLQITSSRDKFGIHTLDYYLRAWQIFYPRNQARLLLAEYQGQLLAGIFVGLFAKQGIYLYGASSNEQRHLMPNYLLQWEAIRWARREGATRYDFWGIGEHDKDEALAGVSRFKSGWGGEVVRFPGNYEHVYHPLPMRVARRFLPRLSS